MNNDYIVVHIFSYNKLSELLMSETFTYRSSYEPLANLLLELQKKNPDLSTILDMQIKLIFNVCNSSFCNCDSLRMARVNNVRTIFKIFFNERIYGWII